MFKHKITIATAGIALAFMAGGANAGIKLTDEKSGVGIDIGGRLQSLVLFNDDDFKPDQETEFRVRRARFRMAITPHPKMSMFLQTEFANDEGGAGGDVRLIDAFITLKPNPWAQIVSGLNMAPAQRQNLTSSGAMMAFDRPGINNYNLTWGLKGNAGLQTGTVPGTRIAGSIGDNQVRDLGITLFGSGSLNDNTHLKYYLGTFDGSVHSDDTLRVTGRVQLNFGDPEPKYYNASTYLGKINTFGIGAAIDTQDSFATNAGTGEDVDYQLFSVDAFLERQLGGGSVTLEAAFTELDLDDTVEGLADQDGVPLRDSISAEQAQGSGAYIQAGYLMGKWQPFVLVEQWEADADNDVGSWSAYRVGINYYLKGHNANIKLGIETIENDADNVDDITTAGIGLYITF